MRGAPILRDARAEVWHADHVFRSRAPQDEGGERTQTVARSLLLHRRLLLIRPQHELLHAPVQDLGDIELVLGRTGDLVNPSELLGLLARAAEIAQHLALQAELVD